jgi:hypothetical protein
MFEFIVVFYNWQRRLSSLGFMSPTRVEELRLEPVQALARVIEAVFARYGTRPLFAPDAVELPPELGESRIVQWRWGCVRVS